ncbi:selenocysteine-specific translation elongation factor [Phycicoccus sonneratiae]|uniref:Selenocysteine-specific translation elongation factor n=1 Tax=Phycicoccus sonneratiae TaxID=2807628 RepID=A0ABS2CRS3_9MICO|nr:selenocysteine-specific translation elongation factor [Phycicoccus sonneraticus]MBM6402584.1 selenocysteine-specific translation elongation factor [Phycicoccus sonneraticus]
MLVVATAGHVDHGKSALVRALTGTEPDRLAEERRRGLTIELGHVWTTLPSGRRLAVVDVPGHADYVRTMLAGVVPLRTVLLVVAADEGWSAQTAEHVAALDALGIRRGLVVVTKTDLADPAPVAADVRARLAGTSLAGLDVLPVSARTGDGMDALRAALDRPDEAPAVEERRARLWVDRVFTVRGAGTVVTGTLASGRLATSDAVLVGGRPSRIRRLESLGSVVDEALAPARVAVNLRDLGADALHRGEALVHPDAWWPTRLADAATDRDTDPPTHAVLHVGSAAVPVRVRPLGPRLLRLALDAEVPLSVGDRAVLRDPGRRQVVGGATVLDPDPPALRGRGSAARRAADLADDPTGLGGAVRRRGVLAVDDARRLGLTVEPAAGVVAVGEHLVDEGFLDRLAGSLRDGAEEARRADPTDAGPPLAALARAHAVPDAVVRAAAARAGLDTTAGRAAPAGHPDLGPHEAAVRALEARLAADPFDAPTRPELADLGLDDRVLAAAVRADRLVRPAPDVVLRPGALDEAAERLLALDPPWTLAEARETLATSRRVALAVCTALDARRVTRRLPDGRREPRTPR